MGIKWRLFTQKLSILVLDMLDIVGHFMKAHDKKVHSFLSQWIESIFTAMFAKKGHCEKEMQTWQLCKQAQQIHLFISEQTG